MHIPLYNLIVSHLTMSKLDKTVLNNYYFAYLSTYSKFVADPLDDYDDNASIEDAEEPENPYFNSRKKGKKSSCNHSNLKCSVHDNDHWQTPPRWTCMLYGHCGVKFFWSSGIMECTCMLFTFENGVLLMR